LTTSSTSVEHTTPESSILPCSIEGSIYQINPFPCALNRVYLNFSANVTLHSSTRLTVSGLCGFLTEDDAFLEINEIQTNLLNASAVWTQESKCTLVLTTVKNVAPNEKIEFWVELRNNHMAKSGGGASDDRLLRTAASVTVRASAICVNTSGLVRFRFVHIEGD